MTTLRLRTKVNFPATVTATGGIGVLKTNGIWTVRPDWSGLQLQTSFVNPATEEIWAHDPVGDVYYRIAVQAFINALPAGPAGATGATGAAGPGAGMKYSWLTSVTNADPGSGNIKGNNATIASITNLYISETDGSSNAVSAVIATWDDSTSTIKATVRIYDPTNESNFAIFSVTGAIIDNGTWDTVPVTYVTSGGTLTNALAVRVNATIAGNAGTNGAVAINGTPSLNQFGVWFDATTLKGISITGLVKGNGASAPAAATAGTDYMAPGTTSAVTIGFTVTPNNIGTVSSGTTTPNLALGNYQYYTNNGAHTLAAPAADGAVDILITNGASAGAITFSGFTVSTSIGDALTTTNTNKFIVSIRRINSVATYLIKALQ